jgi:hypothetical protein
LFSVAGASAAHVAADAVAEQRELAAALLRSYRRGRNYEAAALSEPLTEAVLQPPADQRPTRLAGADLLKEFLDCRG